MLTIRLQRVGKMKRPTYRLIISEKGRDTHDRYLELLGTYNPHAASGGVELKADRIKYWIEKGAQTSNTVNNLLVKAGVLTGKAKKSVFLSEKRKKKIDEKKKANALKTEAVPVATETPAA